MQTSLYKEPSLVVLSLSSYLFSGPANTKAMEQEQKDPPAAVSVIGAEERSLQELY